MRVSRPYHEGERAVQERAGERALAERNGSVIDTTIPTGAMAFIGQQRFTVIGTADAEGQPWASLVAGPPGFIHAPAPDTVLLSLETAWRHPADAWPDRLATEPRLGMLLIELGTRRRLRVSGTAACDQRQVRVAVERAYPNCPKYIQRRHLRVAETSIPPAAPARRGIMVHDDQRDILESADTLFVASLHHEHGIDASHRGGRPGFLRLLDSATLRIPDYPGNSMFNTLGNLTVHPRVGLLVPDFEAGRALHLIGSATVRWDLADPEGVTAGTGRFWDVTIAETLELPLPPMMAWEFLDASPFNP